MRLLYISVLWTNQNDYVPSNIKDSTAIPKVGQSNLHIRIKIYKDGCNVIYHRL